MPEHEAPARILVAEADTRLLGMLAGLLTGAGYEAEQVTDGHSGMHRGLTHRFDLLVLGRHLPVVDGLDLLTRLRSRAVVAPVLFLSPADEPADRIACLDAGADDYLVTPVDPGELLARLRALRRRHLDDARTLPLPGGRLNLDTRLAKADGRAPVRLSERECELLALLAARPGQVFSRARLRSLVFGDTEAETVVETYVHYLRRKLGRRIVATARGLGYQLGTLSGAPPFQG